MNRFFKQKNMLSAVIIMLYSRRNCREKTQTLMREIDPLAVEARNTLRQK